MDDEGGMFVCVRGGYAVSISNYWLFGCNCYGVVWILYGLCMSVQITRQYLYLSAMSRKVEQKVVAVRKSSLNSGGHVSVTKAFLFFNRSATSVVCRYIVAGMDHAKIVVVTLCDGFFNDGRTGHQ